MRTQRRTLTSTFTLLLATAGAGLTLAAVGPTGPASAAPPDCQGQPATIEATANKQVIQGTAGPDVIVTFGFESVRVEAGGGNDVVCSSMGRQAEVFGEAGDDTLVDVQRGEGLSAPGNLNTLIGGPGKDSYVGTVDTFVSFETSAASVSINANSRTVVDGADTDTFTGSVWIMGSPFADQYVGTPGGDRYWSSRFTSDTGADIIKMGGGDDVVRAGLEGTVNLGTGNDRAQSYGASVNGQTGNDKVELIMGGTVLGGAGNDTLSGRGVKAGTTNPTPLRPFRLLGEAGNDVIIPPFALDGAVPTACTGADTTWCAKGTLVGGPGSDTLDLPSRGGSVDLAAGFAKVPGGRSAIGYFETVVGSQSREIIRGDEHRNRFYGMGGSDSLFGRAGDDLLIGGTGSDAVRGGTGRDRCEAEVRTSC